MKTLSFTKMNGAGNDFIIIDGDKNPRFKLTDETIKLLCDRHNGIGADGLIVILSSGSHDFEMKYFNADASTGSLCGNGARCAIRFALKTNRINNNYTKFISNNSEYSGEILENGMIRFNLHPPTEFRKNIKINALGEEMDANFINTGSPHIVIKMNNLEELSVEKLGKEIRNLAEFSPAGVNVNFISIKNKEVNIRTYERGVENETLACGTGSVAAAIASFITEGIEPPVTILPRSKVKLFVNFSVEKDKIINVSLTGPAVKVFEGQIHIN